MSEQTDQQRLRELRDKALEYTALNGADKPKGLVSIADLKAYLGVTPLEWRSLYLMLHNQHLAVTDGSDSHIRLTDTGCNEANRLNQPEQHALVINASYSIVQLAGAHSSQTAQLDANHSQITTVLDKIEGELPHLELDPSKRDEAVGIVAALRAALLKKLPAAGIRAMAAVLSGITTEAGSELGHQLLQLLGMG
jgi:hypothetical protein